MGPSGKSCPPAVLALLLAPVLAACASGEAPAFGERALPGLFDEVAIADPEEALTFARAGGEGAPRLLVVSEYRGGMVGGTDVSMALGRHVSDPIALVAELGYEPLRQLTRGSPPAARVAVPASSLVAPVDLHGHHIAAGTNFPEHAGDAGVEDGPFLFAKLVQPSGPYDVIPASQGLLDYEAEVAWVTLQPLAPGAVPELMGLMLCNDVTDRELLMRHLDPWNVASGDGFTTGKSLPGYLPLGNLFVVPRDHRRFAAGIELRLFVNDALRQRSPAKEMIWDIDEIVARTWAAKEKRWEHRGRQVSLLDGAEAIPARTLLLSGTPSGTVFEGLATRHYVSGLTTWLLGGWSESVPSHVVGAYLGDAHAAGIYLRDGDRVEIHVDRLGVLRNRVGASM